MVCSKCGSEAKDGRIIKGEAVCRACINAERTAQGKLHTFYVVKFGTYNRVPEVHGATYRETPKYLIFESGSEKWPYEKKVFKSKYGFTPPGTTSPQAAVESKLKSLQYSVESAKAKLEREQHELDIFTKWMNEAGYAQPEKEAANG